MMQSSYAAAALPRAASADALLSAGPRPASPAVPVGLQGVDGPGREESDHQAKLRKAFDSFVGEVFYGQMLRAMRQSLGKPAYFHGGRGEEIFQSQLDQVLTERMAKSSASAIAAPMFELFSLNRA
jgi:hypothetical protein